MKTYEMPDGGDVAAGVAEVAQGASAAYSLEEQVRKTSEAVERVSGIMAAFISEARARGGAPDGEA